jgi:hypothetical protein
MFKYLLNRRQVKTPSAARRAKAVRARDCGGFFKRELGFDAHNPAREALVPMLRFQATFLI